MLCADNNCMYIFGQSGEHTSHLSNSVELWLLVILLLVSILGYHTQASRLVWKQLQWLALKSSTNFHNMERLWWSTHASNFDHWLNSCIKLVRTTVQQKLQNKPAPCTSQSCLSHTSRPFFAQHLFSKDETLFQRVPTGKDNWKKKGHYCAGSRHNSTDLSALLVCWFSLQYFIYSQVPSYRNYQVS
jgi:hypothetical protein